MVAGHAFLSYVREDSLAVDRLQRVLEAAGMRVWRDTEDLWPGEDWRSRIRRAITDNALAFIACFSQNSVDREKSYQNEELVLAIEQLRLRRPDDSWLIPVRFDGCVIPDREIGGGRTLASIQRADLFGDRDREGIARLVAAVLRILGRHSDVAVSAQATPATQIAGAVPGSGPEVERQEVMTNPASLASGPLMPAETPDVAAAANGRAGTRPAVTDRWKLTHTTTDAPAMAQLGNQGFDHRAYSRPAEQAPPWARIRAVVACDPLGDTPGGSSDGAALCGSMPISRGW